MQKALRILLLSTTLFCLIQTASAQSPPNIVFILTDDMGWNGTSVLMEPTIPTSASDFYETPYVEQLADSGIIFSRAYAAATVCSPSRGAILAGKTPARTNFTDNTNDSLTNRPMLEAISVTAIDQIEVSLPEQIKAINANYMTANFGKWDISPRTDGPANHGFDRSFGNVDTRDGDSPDPDDPKRMFTMADSAVAFIRDAKSSGRPFYLQISHNAPHTTFQARPVTAAHWAQKTPGSMHSDPLFGAMIADLDSSTGIVMQELLSNGYNTSNTYFIFMSDHGGLDGQNSHGVLKDGKGSLYEGGLRVPLIVTGPGIAKGSRLDQMVSALDLYPTFMEWISGDQLHVPADLDGGSMAELLAGTSTTVARDNKLFFHVPQYNTMASSIIMDSLKFLALYDRTGGSYELFDIKNDISETTNLVDEPAFATPLSILRCELREFLLSTNASRPMMNPAHSAFSGLGGTPTDVDNDMLLDEWEFEQNLTPRNDGMFDSDGDGDNDLTEYTNQTDPLCNLTTAIDEPTAFSHIKMYPNPTTGMLSFEGIEYASFVSVTNILGQEVGRLPFKKTLDLSFLNEGLYIIRVFEKEKRLYVGRLVLR